MLLEHGFDRLSPEDQAGYFPQFVAEAELRLGGALGKFLTTPESAGMFAHLLESDAGPDAWLAFWKKNVPSFEQVVEETLQKYATEVAAAFSL